MRLSLAFYNGCVDDTADFGWIHSNNATFRADLASLAGASYTFVILRCPYARLASGYLDKIVAGKPPSNKLHRPSVSQVAQPVEKDTKGPPRFQ